MLLVAVLLLAVLLITIPAIIFLNGTTSRAGVATVKKQKSTAVALEGVAYAEHALSKDWTTWSNALNGVCPAEFTTNGTPTIYTGASGNPFSIQCISSDPPGYKLQNYELELLIHGGIPDPATGLPSYKRAYKVVLAQNTLAAVQPTGTQASAALELMNIPLLSDGLVVHWGPVVIYNSNPWIVHYAMDNYLFPRKFSQGPITGTSYARNSVQGTDTKEYWSNSAFGFNNFINTKVYSDSATWVTNISTPTNPQGPGNFDLNQSQCPTTNPNCGLLTLNVGLTSATISGGYTLLKASSVVYINGNVVFDDMFMDLKNGGALVIIGDLTLRNSGNSSVPLNLRVPPTAANEYPYYSVAQTSWPSSGWPCKGQLGGTCGSNTTGLGLNDTNGLGSGGGSGKVNFRGFLYVTGNLNVQSPGWLISGAVRVGGQLNAPSNNVQGVPNSPSLTILYDDQVNHNISVNPLQLMVDYQKECIPCSF
jgi:hypothetical protein